MQYQEVLIEASAKLEIYHSLLGLLIRLEDESLAPTIRNEMLRYYHESEKLFAVAKCLDAPNRPFSPDDF